MKKPTNNYDAIILGAGGAGLMCAAIAGQRGKNILLVDHGAEPGRKIIISGGGRCNFTNIETSSQRFLSANPHFAKSALGRYQPRDFIALIDTYNIAWHEKELGQLFCDGSARQIVAMLLDQCEKGEVTLELGREVAGVTCADGKYSVDLADHTATAPALVVATGGASIPKMGATDFAYRLARQFGLKVVEPRPALVPLKLGSDEALFTSLSGVSADTIVSCGKVSFRNATLFTHRGMSGPAILQISSYWRKGDQISIGFLPDRNPGWLLQAKKLTPKASLQTVLATGLPARLATALAERINPGAELANMPDKKLNAAEHRLADWRFTPTGSEGFAKAEVTVGGVSTADLSSRTLAAKRVPGLYFIGEAVDVTGWLGGYNFQWAWASGWAAGQAL